MINFSDERSRESSERHQKKTDKGASVVAQERLLARQAVQHSERLALAYVLADHLESETVVLPHRDVREVVCWLLELVEFLDSQIAPEEEQK